MKKTSQTQKTKNMSLLTKQLLNELKTIHNKSINKDEHKQISTFSCELSDYLLLKSIMNINKHFSPSSEEITKKKTETSDLFWNLKHKTPKLLIIWNQITKAM